MKRTISFVKVILALSIICGGGAVYYQVIDPKVVSKLWIPSIALNIVWILILWRKIRREFEGEKRKVKDKAFRTIVIIQGIVLVCFVLTIKW